MGDQKTAKTKTVQTTCPRPRTPTGPRLIAKLQGDVERFKGWLAAERDRNWNLHQELERAKVTIRALSAELVRAERAREDIPF